MALTAARFHDCCERYPRQGTLWKSHTSLPINRCAISQETPANTLLGSLQTTLLSFSAIVCELSQENHRAASAATCAPEPTIQPCACFRQVVRVARVYDLFSTGQYAVLHLEEDADPRTEMMRLLSCAGGYC